MPIIRLLFLIGCFCFGQSLAAQTKSTLDSIWREIDLDDVVVTAQYVPTHAKNAVHQVRVIKALEIEQQGQNNLAEVLTNQLNLRVSTDPILGNGLQIQGIGGENIQILIDGVPVIGRVNGNIDLSQINLHNVDRIEIIEGALSAQYGSNASGGVVNIITKKSQLPRLKVESRNQYEDIGILNNALSLGAQFGKLYAAVNGVRFESRFADEDSLRLYETRTLPSGDSYRTKTNPWNPKLQYGLDGTLRYRWSDSLNLTYQYRYFDEDLVRFGEVRRPQFQPYAFDENYRTLRQDHSLRLESHFNSKWYLNSTMAYNQFDRIKESLRLDIESATTTPIADEQDTTNFTALLHRSVLSTTFSGSLNGQAGLEAMHETGTGGRIVDSTSAPYDKAVLTNYAAWIGLRLQTAGNMTLSANLRYGHNTKFDHPLIPSFHAQWQPNRQWQLKMSYAHGFRAPSLKELHFNFVDVNHFIIGNPDLQPENSRNASLALNFEPLFGSSQPLTISGRLFYNHIRDRIVLAEFSAAQFNYQNLEEFRTHGINVRLDWQVKPALRLKAGYAHTRLSNTFSRANFTGPDYRGFSEWQNELHYDLPGIASRLLVIHRFFGRQVRFFENTEGIIEEGSLGQYHLLNATLSRNFWGDRLFIAVGAKNLLDTETISLSGQGGGGAHSTTGDSQLLGWGRTLFIRASLTFTVR